MIENTFQTNGVLLDEQWCQFFRENGFLIGLSIAGPKELHDFYRKDKGGQGTWERVVKAARLLQKHAVAFNILCAVNSRNAEHPLQVYRFFRDELGAQYLQFIPIVERNNERGFQEGDDVTDRSVSPEKWGRFLIEIFDEWVRRDVGRMFVLNFDGALAGWLGMAGTLCIFGPTCGLGMALEHNGDLQKNRFTKTKDGDRNGNYLCSGYKAFFAHSEHPMRIMADLLLKGHNADGIMKILKDK